jgi:hypothetical protein
MRPPEQDARDWERWEPDAKVATDEGEPAREAPFVGPAAAASHAFARSSIAHWQLRQLLSCPRRAGEVFATAPDGTLARYDLDARTREVASRLPFEPTCLAVATDMSGEGWLCAGGAEGLLDVRRLEPEGAPRARGAAEARLGARWRAHRGASVTNHVRVARDASGAERLFACNNDEVVRVLALADGSLVSFLRAPAPVNCCDVAAGGALVALVGDDRAAHLYAAAPAGWRRLCALGRAGDAGMAVAFAPGAGAAAALVAAAFQDGGVAVWDARAPPAAGPAARLRAAAGGAARALAWAPAPLDLLAFTEHRGRAHVADARVWGRPWALEAGPPYGGAGDEGDGGGADIAGLAFSPCGSALYVSTEDAVEEFAVRAGARRSFAWCDAAA